MCHSSDLTLSHTHLDRHTDTHTHRVMDYSGDCCRSAVRRTVLPGYDSSKLECVCVCVSVLCVYQCVWQKWPPLIQHPIRGDRALTSVFFNRFSRQVWFQFYAVWTWLEWISGGCSKKSLSNKLHHGSENKCFTIDVMWCKKKKKKKLNLKVQTFTFGDPNTKLFVHIHVVYGVRLAFSKELLWQDPLVLHFMVPSEAKMVCLE